MNCRAKFFFDLLIHAGFARLKIWHSYSQINQILIMKTKKATSQLLPFMGILPFMAD